MTKLRVRLVLAGRLVAVLALAPACRSNVTTASRSAAAYDEAVRNGTLIKAGEEHGGHGQVAEKAPGAMNGMDHSGMAARPEAPMKGMDHSTMGASGKTGGMAGMDHSGMAGKPDAVMKGMDHSKTGASGRTGDMAGMDHSAMGASGKTGGTAGMQHSAMSPQMGMNMARPKPKPEPVTATAASGQPAATLRSDAIDRTVATSIEDAARAATMVETGAMQHGTYKQTDAGRVSATPSPSPSPTPRPKPSPSPATSIEGARR